MEQPEADINKPKNHMVSPKGPLFQTENLNASPNQESQDQDPSEEVRPVYAQPELSKKKTRRRNS